MNCFIWVFILFLTVAIRGQSWAITEEFYIIYTANINGMIENCGCGADPLGGIGRVKTYIDKFIKTHENVIIIDGGDYFNSYPFPRLNEAMYASLLLLDYDCLIPGDQAFVEGDAFFANYVSTLKDKIVVSNSSAELQVKMIKNIGSSQIQIYGYLSPYVFEFIKKPERLNLTNFLECRTKPAKKNDFQIAVIHGYLSNAEQFASENTSVRLILLAHDQRKGIWQKDQATIIGNGKDSEYITIIKVNPGDHWDLSIDQLKIHEKLPEDEHIVKIIEEYKSN
jgi:2',3'-cyclic-nucleotide 2'-phosphodiesterase (5'-nucleotidase family)